MVYEGALQLVSFLSLAVFLWIGALLVLHHQLTIGELVERTVDDLLGITNFGQKSLDEVLQKLDERGLSLRNNEG